MPRWFYVSCPCVIIIIIIFFFFFFFFFFLLIKQQVQPKQVKMPGKVTHVACGYYHTAAVTQDGQLYTFGENESSQQGLGAGRTQDVTKPTKTNIPGKVLAVACGSAHTVALSCLLLIQQKKKRGGGGGGEKKKKKKRRKKKERKKREREMC